MHMTGFPPNENKIGTIFGVSYWLSSEAKTPVPQAMEPLDMLGNPPSINETRHSHIACLTGQKPPKNDEKVIRIVDKILRVYERELPLAMF